VHFLEASRPYRRLGANAMLFFDPVLRGVFGGDLASAQRDPRRRRRHRTTDQRLEELDEETTWDAYPSGAGSIETSEVWVATVARRTGLDRRGAHKRPAAANDFLYAAQQSVSAVDLRVGSNAVATTFQAHVGPGRLSGVAPDARARPCGPG
jgi:hypothetical protein